MALRLESPAQARGSRALDAALQGRLASHALTGPRRRLGVEHEYAVFEGDRQVDFRDHVHHLPVDARALHPVNRHMLFTASGIALMADGVVAEIASPPEPLRRGFGAALEAWGASGRALLDASLPPSLRLVPGSTHISVETHPSRTDQLCWWFAQTFAPALMLLVDNAESPGALVRPRPSRFEFGGEFVDGIRLRAAATFAVGAVLALEQARRLPPTVQVALEPARQRYGWYIDRTAFGPDLYTEGRAARLRLTTGETVTAQAHMEACWAIAREALTAAGDLADPDDIEAVERIVRGDIPLPCEHATWNEALPAIAPPASAYASLAHTRHGVTVTPVTATWDFVVFRVTRGASQVMVSVPESQLGSFATGIAAGDLDDLVARALDVRALPTLRAHSQTLTAGFFTAVVPGDALLPRDRVGVGAGPVSTVRPGKVDPPQPPPPHRDPVRRGGFPWLWVAVAIGCIGLLWGGLTVMGDDLDPGQPTPTPTSIAGTPTSTPATPLPVIGPITSVAGPLTVYTLDTSQVSAQESITIEWSGSTCGSAVAEGNRYSWDHREVVIGLTGGLGNRELGRAGTCDHRADPTHGNPLIVAQITGKSFTAQCTFQGAGAGVGPRCTVQRRP